MGKGEKGETAEEEYIDIVNKVKAPPLRKKGQFRRIGLATTPDDFY